MVLAASIRPGRTAGHNSAGRLFWRAGPPDGPAAITGVDVAHIEGGRIKLLYVFVDPTARWDALEFLPSL